eukprot:g37487.t1
MLYMQLYATVPIFKRKKSHSILKYWSIVPPSQAMIKRNTELEVLSGVALLWPPLCAPSKSKGPMPSSHQLWATCYPAFVRMFIFVRMYVRACKSMLRMACTYVCAELEQDMKLRTHAADTKHNCAGLGDAYDMQGCATFLNEIQGGKWGGNDTGIAYSYV